MNKGYPGIWVWTENNHILLSNITYIEDDSNDECVFCFHIDQAQKVIELINEAAIAIGKEVNE